MALERSATKDQQGEIVTYAFRIDTATSDGIEEGIDRSPHYELRVANALRRTIEVIHGLADLHRWAELDELDVYLGRAACSGPGVLRRWQCHRSERSHKFGTVLFSCDTSRVEDLETIAIRALGRLRAGNMLCVGSANVSQSGYGQLPSTRNAVVYLTWRLRDETREFTRPTAQVIREIAADVADEVGTIRRQQLETGLAAARRANLKAHLEWFPD
jgi:hypothetical protein